jgi:transcriptional regulator with XRE-family HTH domain
MLAAAASSGGVMSAMPAQLQIAKAGATENCCSLREARIAVSSQAAMMDDEKNGGPNFLQAWRLYNHMSQEKLAAEVGTTAAVISLLESGDRALSAKWLRRLAPVLKTTPGRLLDHHPDDVDQEVMAFFSNVSQFQKRQIIEIAKAITKTGSED